MSSRRTFSSLSFWFGLFCLSFNFLAHADSIVNSKHNLAITGPGEFRALAETEICIFCHTPHQASAEAPLWNHAMPAQHYTPYTSTTMKAPDVAQPTGSSKVCLSCHDGTVALGMVNSLSAPIKMQGGVTTLPLRPSRVGTDLSDDHPISFRYDLALASANGQLKDPSTLNQRVRLDDAGQVQCTSCHDPHDNQYGKFLVVDNTGSALCMNCHDQKRWESSIHKTSSAVWSGQGLNPWPHTSGTTVTANGCENCHAPHTAGTRPRLLNYPIAEQNCYSCHSANVAEKNIQGEFNKISAHPIATTGDLHDEAEDLVNPPRHATCVDCHNPHAVQLSPPTSLHAPGSLVGVKGVSAAAGTLVNPVTKESELCYRCHGDSTARGPALVTRQIPETNKRYQFSPANASFHPLEAVGKDLNVPSLISPLTVSSLMTCTDCHNNNEGPGAGGTGPRGPHGSLFAPILERQLQLTDYAAEGPGPYALCYKCHSRDSILADQSFKGVSTQPATLGQDRGHRFHIVDVKAACTTCHDSHGVVSNPRLINFNTLYVTNSSAGFIEYKSTGPGSGNCTLSCHGRTVSDPPFDHVNTAYPSPTSAMLKSRTPRKHK